MESKAKANARRVITATTELALCSGSLAAASRRLGRRRNYFSRVRERGAMEWRSYFAALETFGVDHVRFTRWAHCADREPALEAFGDSALAIALKGEPSIVRSVRLAYLQGHLDEGPLGVVQTAFLDELHALRRSDGPKTAARAKQALDGTGSALFAARLLGVWASVLRSEQRPSDAKVALWTAIRIAATIGSCAESFGGLVQRACYVAREFGDLEQGTRLADLACRHYEMAQRPALHGRAMVDRGIMYHSAGSYEAAETSLNQALKWVGRDDHDNRSAAYHLLADIATRSGRLDQARGMVDLAIAEAPPDQQTRGRLHWLRARISVALDDPVAATHQYAKAADALGLLAPVDAALVTAEHTRLLVRLGRATQARKLAEGMRWAIIPLEEQTPQTAAALVDLIVASEQASFEEQATRLANCLKLAVLRAGGDRVARPPRSSIA